MRGTPWPVAALAFGAWGCSLDLVDAVQPGDDVTRLGVALDGQGLSAGTLSASATLRFGRLPNGDVRDVVEPTLGVFGVALEPDTLLDEAGSLLHWNGTVAGLSSTVDLIDLSLPSLAETKTPTLPTMTLRREAVPPEGEAWRPGDDLVLPLAPTTWQDGDATFLQWSADVATWNESGVQVQLLSVGGRAPLPDTLIVPAAWLPVVAGDSIETTVRYTRIFAASSVDEAYQVTVSLRQRFRWLLTVSRSDPYASLSAAAGSTRVARRAGR